MFSNWNTIINSYFDYDSKKNSVNLIKRILTLPEMYLKRDILTMSACLNKCDVFHSQYLIGTIKTLILYFVNANLVFVTFCIRITFIVIFLGPTVT